MRVDAVRPSVVNVALLPTTPSPTSLSIFAMSDGTVPPGVASGAVANRNVGGVRRAQTSNNAVESRPNSTRAAGAGGSSNTMLRIYTDDNKGLSVDPVIVLVLAVSFVFSVVCLHVIGKVARIFFK
ncbi:hypothetical protein BDZ90DRAFT_179940 [Jaminaea rosea]|uniref:Protein transport protein Sec61 subunit beta n=1 Tax=Jaminaea rosea TaxID=1569628 RepID=A0A316UQ94_9BASI|nr:hypothetical protein BDZ90DRAFT_179940 [Jaminaea rosea]PWN27466.1 hypothetical protein BDZ90DRAFT_179940 [Jaminaea rosea]